MRYFMLLPFDLEKIIKSIAQLRKSITSIQHQLVKKAIEKKIIANVPFEIMQHDNIMAKIKLRLIILIYFSN